MLFVGALVLGTQYLSETSMQSIIKVADNDYNQEYDWSLPFVTAADKVVEEPWPMNYNINFTYYN